MKLVAPEAGSHEVQAIWDRATSRTSTSLLYPEARSALARAARAGRIAPGLHGAARARLEDLWESVALIEPSLSLVECAGEVAESEGLRGYDAVHLASFESIADAQTVLVAADRDLLRAARSRGHLTVAAG